MPNQPTSHDQQPQPLYYLDNFQRALAWLQQRYSDLLTSAERDFIDQFTALPEPSRALLVRLIMRKGPHFRSDRLNYPEIGEIAHAAEPLLDLGWLSDAALLSAQELGQLLRKDELITVLSGAPGLQALRKPELVERLACQPPERRPFRQWCPRHAARLLTLHVGDLCEGLRLMFFGNLRQGWEEFVLAQLGVFRYEEVPLTPDSRGFQCREDI